VERLKLSIALLAVVLIAALMPIWAGGSDIYPWPTNYSLGGLASWSQPLLASGSSVPLVASLTIGDLYVVSDAASWTLYRRTGSTMIQMVASGTGGGGSGDVTSAMFNAHVASCSDPHGATMTVTQRMTVGSGTADAYVSRYATGVVMLASFVYIPPENATPTGIASTTIWHDGNTSTLKWYDGTNWHRLLVPE
jgi:hypothetical protein